MTTLKEIEALPQRDYMPHEAARYMPLLIRAVRQLGADRAGWTRVMHLIAGGNDRGAEVAKGGLLHDEHRGYIDPDVLALLEEGR